MENVTYLLGAGASSEAIPTVADLYDRMAEMSKNIHGLTFPDQGSNIHEVIRLRDGLVHDINQLIREASPYASVDVNMRRHYLLNSEQYHLHKLTFAMYLVLEHLFEFKDNKHNIKTLDVRYDSFLANFCRGDDLVMPPNIKVLTWNCDLQWIKAAMSNAGDYEKSRSFVNILANECQNKSEECFSVYQLNGLAELYEEVKAENGESTKKRTPFISDLNMKFEGNLLLPSLVLYDRLRKAANKQKMSSLTFSWETNRNGNNTTIDLALEGTVKTTTLVLVGYSLPFFNRKIDKALIKNMRSLSMVYVQGRDLEDSTNIADKFKKTFNYQYTIEPLGADSREFFVPPSIDFDF